MLAKVREKIQTREGLKGSFLGPSPFLAMERFHKAPSKDPRFRISERGIFINPGFALKKVRQAYLINILNHISAKNKSFW
jgi:hypothetical protein